MKYKAVIFDFDGTLMDTSEGIFKCGRRAMEHEGLEIKSDARWDLFIGPPLAMCFKLTFGITDSKVLEKLCKAYRTFYFAEGQYEACFYQGIPEVLRELKKQGYKVLCASMKYEELVESMCVHFGIRDCFDAILGLDTTENNTKELLIKKGCEMFSIKPEEAVLIGDTGFDEEGALRAGCAFIPVSWGFGFKADKPGVINRAEEILKLV